MRASGVWQSGLFTIGMFAAFIGIYALLGPPVAFELPPLPFDTMVSGALGFVFAAGLHALARKFDGRGVFQGAILLNPLIAIAVYGAVTAGVTLPGRLAGGLTNTLPSAPGLVGLVFAVVGLGVVWLVTWRGIAGLLGVLVATAYAAFVLQNTAALLAPHYRHLTDTPALAAASVAAGMLVAGWSLGRGMRHRRTL
jgi:hypothetical protein